MLHDLALAFIPLFVAVDVVGLLPIYLGLTGGLDPARRRPIPTEATLTAAAVGMGFLLVGDATLDALGATVGDLQIAGGLLLLVFAIHDLINPDVPLRKPGTRVGVMPLGVPLIAGPAVLTSLLTLASTRGRVVTLVAFALNLVLVWAVLRAAPWVHRLLGTAGSQAVAKVASLLLAAIGVTFIRAGVAAALADLLARPG